MLVAPKVPAGSLIVEHLATVREVQVDVIVSGLAFEPIPGFDRNERDMLREELTATIVSLLTEAGIPIAKEASSKVTLDLDSAWTPQAEYVALHVELTLQQRATSFAGVEPRLDSPIWATVWNDGRVSLSTIEKAREEILEQAELEVERLIGEIQSASSYAARNRR